MAKRYKFPKDEESCGGFRTKLVFKSWMQSGEQEAKSTGSWIPDTSTGSVKGQVLNYEKVVGQNEFTIWLPMPLTLGTNYSGSYDEMDDFKHTARKDIARLSLVNESRGLGIIGGLMNELAKTGNVFLTPNASSTMSQDAILNNNMGVEYKGARLRSHSFSWRLTPKSEAEQFEINKIIQVMKLNSAPTLRSRDETFNFFQDAEYQGKNISELEKAVEVAEDKLKNPSDKHVTILAANVAKADAQADLQRAQLMLGEGTEFNKKKFATAEVWGQEVNAESIEAVTSLTIPHTVEVSFWKDYELNPHLFKIADSFITSFDINYTTQGTWSAHEDGAPLETQITITLKEIKPQDAAAISSGGY